MIKVTAVSTNAAPRALAIKHLVFPGGEMHVQVEVVAVSAEKLVISAHLPNSDAVMTLFMVTDAVRRAYPGLPVELDMPYTPYARQDRVANAGEAHSAKVFCTLINSQGYSAVRITDPHSDVVSALLDRVEVRDVAVLVKEVLQNEAFARGVTLLAPDAGARKRVLTIAKAVGVEAVGFADKVRDTKTGAITGTRFPTDIPADLPVLVVDDICDGGRTFIELAKAAKENEALGGPQLDLYLYVTHGIFSKGVDPLAYNFKRIFTATDWTDSKHAALTVVGQ